MAQKKTWKPSLLYDPRAEPLRAIQPFKVEERQCVMADLTGATMALNSYLPYTYESEKKWERYKERCASLVKVTIVILYRMTIEMFQFLLTLANHCFRAQTLPEYVQYTRTVPSLLKDLIENILSVCSMKLYFCFQRHELLRWVGFRTLGY